AGRARDHGLDEALVARHVDEPEAARPDVEVGEAELDGDAALLLLLEPVGVDAGQRPDERGLAVIDVPRGAEYDGIGLQGSQVSLSSLFSTFPVGFRGKLGTNAKCLGALKLASVCCTKARSSSAVALAPGRRTTKAFSDSPHSASGTPMTATSATAGWACSRCS